MKNGATGSQQDLKIEEDEEAEAEEKVEEERGGEEWDRLGGMSQLAHFTAIILFN